MKKVLLTMKGCPACSEVKAELKRDSVKFKEIDANTKKGIEIANKLDIDVVPEFICKGKVVNMESWKKCR